MAVWGMTLVSALVPAPVPTSVSALAPALVSAPKTEAVGPQNYPVLQTCKCKQGKTREWTDASMTLKGKAWGTEA